MRYANAGLAVSVIVGVGWLFSGCSDEPVTGNTPSGAQAYPILEQQGSLHTFNVVTFQEDQEQPQNGVFVLNTDNFTPSTGPTQEPSNAPTDTIYRLGYTVDNWVDPSRQWLTNNAPLSSNPLYTKLRPFRVLQNGQLGNPVTDRLNQPIYRESSNNIFEDRAAAIFRWRVIDTSGGRIANRRISDFETLVVNGETIELLPDVKIWGQNGNTFGADAALYPMYAAVDNDVYTVESVADGTDVVTLTYTLDLTEFGVGLSTLEEALALYPTSGTERLEYRFTVQYLSNRVMFMTFDTSTQMASLYTTSSGGEAVNAPYNINTGGAYVEIDVTGLSDTQQATFGLQPWFNPIITGPFTSISDPTKDAFFYGRRYIQTTNNNQQDLPPFVLFNPEAHDNLETTFQEWRISEAGEGENDSGNESE